MKNGKRKDKKKERKGKGKGKIVKERQLERRREGKEEKSALPAPRRPRSSVPPRGFDFQDLGETLS